MISINVNLANSTTSVKVMPEGALYWYGNECEDLSGGLVLNQGVFMPKTYLPLKNTNNISMNAPAGYYAGTVTPSNKIDLNSFSLLKINVSDCDSSVDDKMVRLSRTTTINENIINTFSGLNSIGIREYNISTINESAYINTICYSDSTNTYKLVFTALWLE